LAPLKGVLSKTSGDGIYYERISALAFMLALSQSSCIMVGGYRSDGGWYIWPGSFLSILVIAVVAFLLLRRRR
jgi:hypothetical protein